MSGNGNGDIPVVATDRIREVKCSGCGATLDVSELDPFSQIACPSCGAQLVVPASLGPFLLTGLIASGGMGAIYRGKDDSLDREVAIKVMLESIGKDRELVETFKREARMAAALNHPNIVHIYSFGEAKGQPYIAMELVPGKSLEEMMAEGPLAEAHVLQVGIDVAKGLSTAYEIGLMHGDVKPKNILFDAKGTAKVVDFGLATFVDKHSSSSGGIWGTPYYIAPEKLLKQPLDARSDIYSLGATMYHVLTNRPPFDGETPVDVATARLAKKPNPPLTLRKDISAKTNGIILRMLEDKPARRYPTYASLLGDMENTLADLKHNSAAASTQVKIAMTRRTKVIKKDEVQPPADNTPAAEPEAVRAPIEKRAVELPAKTAANLKARKPATTATRPQADKQPKKPGNPAVLFALIAGGLAIVLIVILAVVMSKSDKKQSSDQISRYVKQGTAHYQQTYDLGAYVLAEAIKTKQDILALNDKFTADKNMKGSMMVRPALTTAETAENKARALQEWVAKAANLRDALVNSTTEPQARQNAQSLESYLQHCDELAGQARFSLDYAKINLKELRNVANP